MTIDTIVVTQMNNIGVVYFDDYGAWVVTAINHLTHQG